MQFIPGDQSDVYRALVFESPYDLGLRPGNGNDYVSAFEFLNIRGEDAFNSALNDAFDYLRNHPDVDAGSFAEGLLNYHNSLESWDNQSRFRSAVGEDNLRLLQSALTVLIRKSVWNWLMSAARLESDQRAVRGNDGAAEVVFDSRNQAHFVLDPSEAGDLPSSVRLEMGD